ncbi:MAG: hypothetical protein ACFCUQ_12060 [Kiloniellales bacterium]
MARMPSLKPSLLNRAVVAGLFVTLLLAAQAPGSRAQLSQTDPNHYGSGVGQSRAPATEGRGVPDFRSRNPNSRLLMDSGRRLRDGGPPDRRLTQACRNGRFRQAVDHRFVARLDGQTYGAGIGGRSMLYDPQRMAQDGILYVFVGQGTTNCQVYMLGIPNAR